MCYKHSHKMLAFCRFSNAADNCLDDGARRLARRKLILDLIDTRRVRESDPGIGASIERQILAEELSSMERDNATA